MPYDRLAKGPLSKECQSVFGGRLQAAGIRVLSNL
jgi:hypothetical protein